MWESSHNDTYTFIYSSSTNTYLIILLLETSTSPLYVLCYTIYLTGCWRPKFNFHGKLDLNTCSVDLPGGGGGLLALKNLILAKWRIALSIDIGVLESH